MEEKRYINYNDEYKSALQKNQAKYKITIISRIGEATTTFCSDDTDGTIINISSKCSTESQGFADGANITMVENLDSRDGLQRGFFAQYLNQYDRINDTIYIEFMNDKTGKYDRVFSGVIKDINRKTGVSGGSVIDIVCAGPAYAASKIGAIPDMLLVTLISKFLKNTYGLFKGADIVKVLLHFVNLCFKGFGEGTFQEYINQYARPLPKNTTEQVPNPIYIHFNPSDDYASDQSLIASINSVDAFDDVLSSFNGTDYSDAAKACDLLYTNVNMQGEDPWRRIIGTASVSGREIWFEHDSNAYDNKITNISGTDTYAGNLLGVAAGLETAISSGMNPGQIFTMRYRLPNITRTFSRTITADEIKEESFNESTENVFTAIPHLKNAYESMRHQLDNLKNTLISSNPLIKMAVGNAAVRKMATSLGKGKANPMALMSDLVKNGVLLSSGFMDIIKDSNMLYITANPDMQKRVGVRMATSETSSELFFPQVTKLAAYRLMQNQYKARTCSVTIVGDPSIKIGRTVRIEKKVGKSNIETEFQKEYYIYYITNVSHSWSINGGYVTTIGLAYGRKENEIPGEFYSLLGGMIGAIFGSTSKNYTTEAISSAKQMLNISEDETISDVNVSDLTYAIMLALNDQDLGDINLNTTEYWQDLYTNGSKEKLYEGGIQLYDKNITNEYDDFIKNAYASAKYKYNLNMDSKTFLSWFKALIGYLSNSSHYNNDSLAIDSDGSFGICRIRTSQLSLIASEYQIEEEYLKNTNDTNSLSMNIYIGILLLAYYLSQTKNMVTAIKSYLNGAIASSYSSAINASYIEINKIKNKIIELNFFKDTYIYQNKSEKVGLMQLNVKYSDDPTNPTDLYDPETSISTSYTIISNILNKYDNYVELSLPNKIRGAALAFKYDYDNLEDIDINDDKDFQKEVLNNYYKLMLSKYTMEDTEEAEEEIRSNEYEDYILPLTNFFLTEKNESGRFGILYPTLRNIGYGYTYGNPGIDLFSIYDVPGDNVYAVSDGIVAGVVSDNVHGNMIWIYHEELERYSGYGHVIDVKVSRGETVEKGDIIGTVGRTSTPDNIRTFLHFEWSVCDPILTNNIPYYRIDPENIIDFDKMSWGAISPLKE